MDFYVNFEICIKKSAAQKCQNVLKMCIKTFLFDFILFDIRNTLKLLWKHIFLDVQQKLLLQRFIWIHNRTDLIAHYFKFCFSYSEMPEC